jgi:hypothetical protein
MNEQPPRQVDKEGPLVMPAETHAIMHPGHSVTVITDTRTRDHTGEEYRVLVAACNGTPENFMQLGVERDCDWTTELELAGVDKVELVEYFPSPSQTHDAPPAAPPAD